MESMRSWRVVTVKTSIINDAVPLAGGNIASLNHLCKSIIFFQVRRIEKFKLKEKLK